MHEELRTLLNAYLDGELQGRHLKELESHLATCPDCRKELEELRLASWRLHADTRVETASADKFVSQLTLSLPRQQQERPPKKVALAWWLVPAGLLAAWVFIQTAAALTDAVSAASLTGMLGNVSHWLGNGQESAWLRAASNLFGGQLVSQPAFSLLNTVSVAFNGIFSGFIWQAVIALLYCAWLGVWWRHRNPGAGKASNTL